MIIEFDKKYRSKIAMFEFSYKLETMPCCYNVLRPVYWNLDIFIYQLVKIAVKNSIKGRLL